MVRLTTSLCAALVLNLTACSSSSSTGTPAGDAGADDSSVEDGGGDAGTDADASEPMINGCTVYVDWTASTARREVAWDFPIKDDPDRCALIKVGQTVTFVGDFVTHPLEASGGTKPNPISKRDETGKITFSAPGTFGYVCGVHPAMTGAIRVVP